MKFLKILTKAMAAASKSAKAQNKVPQPKKQRKPRRFESVFDFVDEADDGSLSISDSIGCDFEIVGESWFQENLTILAGEKTSKGVSIDCMAIVQPDDKNAKDKNAVEVLINGRKVGYLPAKDAKAWRDELVENGYGGRPVAVSAIICGGWKRTSRGELSEGAFGVKLGIDLECDD